MALKETVKAKDLSFGVRYDIRKDATASRTFHPSRDGVEIVSERLKQNYSQNFENLDTNEKNSLLLRI